MLEYRNTTFEYIIKGLFSLSKHIHLKNKASIVLPRVSTVYTSPQVSSVQLRRRENSNINTRDGCHKTARGVPSYFRIFRPKLFPDNVRTRVKVSLWCSVVDATELASVEVVPV